MPSHIISSYHIIYHIKSYHTVSYHTISYHTISYHTISYHTISYHIISYHIISYHIISYHIISCHIISYHINHIFGMISFTFVNENLTLTHSEKLVKLGFYLKSCRDHRIFSQFVFNRIFEELRALPFFS